jgi:DNA-binding LacI/PurR family transcriptional regulator
MKKKRRSGPSKTMDDIAQLANVSKPTVSRALQDSPLVNPTTKARILSIARKHGYSVNRNAQKLRTKRTNTIAVVLHLPPQQGRSISAPFIFQLLADVLRGLSIRKQDLLLCSPEGDAAHAYQAMLASKGADGFIFLGQGVGDAWLRDLAHTDAPFVVWGAVDDRAPYCTVGSDNVRGGMLAGQRFAQLNRKRVLFIGNRTHAEMEQRRQGLESGLGTGKAKPELFDVEIPDFPYDTSYAAMKANLANGGVPPDAIFAASDTIAMAAITALREANLRVPDDISVIGYNDIPSAAHFFPPLTTIRQDTHQAGSLLVEKLFQILDGAKPPSATLPTELIVRQT